jgi:hypothetical protein
MGRPSDYTPELAARICHEVGLGRLVKDVCAELGVDRGTVWRWTEAHPEFRDAYARARVEQAHAMAEDALAIADEDVPTTEHGADSGAVARNRLRVDARKWLVSKIAPKIYGEKQQHEVAGGVVVQVVTGVPQPEAPGGDRPAG